MCVMVSGCKIHLSAAGFRLIYGVFLHRYGSGRYMGLCRLRQKGSNIIMFVRTSIYSVRDALPSLEERPVPCFSFDWKHSSTFRSDCQRAARKYTFTK